MKKMKVKWLGKPQKHDYPAAQSYLSLTLDPKVAKDLADRLERAEILDEALSPLLLYRDNDLGSLIIADGYHRLCAVYTFGENAMIPCKIV